MANHPESPLWVPVYQRERTDLVDAGVNGTGPYNTPIIDLVRRTGYLKTLTDELIAARGTKPVLSDRFNSIETTLATAAKLFGGSGGEGDRAIAGTATLADSEYYYKNLTVGNGGTLTVDRGVNLYASGEVLVQGTINVLQASNGAPARSNTISSGSNTTEGLKGDGQSSGDGTTGGSAYPYILSRAGSGGGSGRMAISGTPATGTTSAGGKGGGFVFVEALGKITISATGRISALGTNGIAGVATQGTVNAGGGGGGSGGLIFLKSLTAIELQAGGILSVAGGAGSAGLGTGYGGGGGGGGGYVVLIAPVITNNGSIILTGGAAGAGQATQIAGGGGGAFGGNGGLPTIAQTPQPGSNGVLVVRNFMAVA